MAYHALTLTAEHVTALGAGRRDLPLASVPGADRCEPGQPVRLMTPAGALAALGVADPENELVRAMAVADEGFLSLDNGFVRARLGRALALRAAFGLTREQTTHRAVNGSGDGLPGLAADVYGDYAVLYAYSKGLLQLGRLLAQELLAALGLSGVVLKLRARDSAQNTIKQEVIGSTPPESLVVLEHGVPYEVHLMSGLNVGLFTDMREHRARIGRFVSGKRVLNLFSYTGSLSVVAARAGASKVTSVDLSSGVHRWARTNFELSGLSADPHRFDTQEISGFMRNAARAGDRFDVIISDPPTYSAARAGAWSMRKDYPELIVKMCALLSPGGVLWLAANARDLPPLPEIAREAFVRAKRSSRLLEVGGLPPDYPSLTAQLEDRYLQLCLFAVD
jgi:23S rRNA (cytosine1962-C5)-methyltransferase